MQTKRAISIVFSNLCNIYLCIFNCHICIVAKACQLLRESVKPKQVQVYFFIKYVIKTNPYVGTLKSSASPPVAPVVSMPKPAHLAPSERYNI